jgi:hypothetical protein
MKLSLATATLLLTATTLSALTDYTPKDGWDSIDYPKGTGENFDKYSAPPGGWESVKYPPGTGGKPSTFPFVFTSTYSVVAKGSEVRNGTVSVPGPEDAVGYFNYGINSKEDTICYVCPHLPRLPNYYNP